MRFGLLLLLAAFVLSVPLAFAGPAQALKTTNPASNYSSPATLKGSNGYRISLYSSSYGGKKSVQFYATKGAQSISYTTRPSKASLTVIKAKFGKFGSVSLKFTATGKPKKQKNVKNCKGRPTVSIKGVFRGKVKFTGSHHFTSVNVKKVKATIYKAPKLICHYPKPLKPPKHGKTTSLSINPPYDSGESWSFSASKTAKVPRAKYLFYASAKAGRVDMTESIYVNAKKATFASNGTATTATVEPPAPFQGSATVIVAGYESTLSGNLKVKSALQGTVNLTALNLSAFLREH